MSRPHPGQVGFRKSRLAPLLPRHLCLMGRDRTLLHSRTVKRLHLMVVELAACRVRPSSAATHANGIPRFASDCGRSADYGSARLGRCRLPQALANGTQSRPGRTLR
jgi:hypothetical protein